MIVFPNLTKLDICANPTGAVGEKALGNIYAPKITCIQFTKNGYSDTFTETSLIAIRNNPKPLTSQPIATASTRPSNPSRIFSRLFGSNPSTRAASATEIPPETRHTPSTIKKAPASSYATPVSVEPSAPPLREATEEEVVDEGEYKKELLCNMMHQLLSSDASGPNGKPLSDKLRFMALATISGVLAQEAIQSEGASEF